MTIRIAVLAVMALSVLSCPASALGAEEQRLSPRRQSMRNALEALGVPQEGSETQRMLAAVASRHNDAARAAERDGILAYAGVPAEERAALARTAARFGNDPDAIYDSYWGSMRAGFRPVVGRPRASVGVGPPNLLSGIVEGLFSDAEALREKSPQEARELARGAVVLAVLSPFDWGMSEAQAWLGDADEKWALLGVEGAQRRALRAALQRRDGDRGRRMRAIQAHMDRRTVVMERDLAADEEAMATFIDGLNGFRAIWDEAEGATEMRYGALSTVTYEVAQLKRVGCEPALARVAEVLVELRANTVCHHEQRWIDETLNVAPATKAPKIRKPAPGETPDTFKPAAPR